MGTQVNCSGSVGDIIFKKGINHKDSQKFKQFVLSYAIHWNTKSKFLRYLSQQGQNLMFPYFSLINSKVFKNWTVIYGLLKLIILGNNSDKFKATRGSLGQYDKLSSTKKVGALEYTCPL